MIEIGSFQIIFQTLIKMLLEEIFALGLTYSAFNRLATFTNNTSGRLRS